MPVNRSERGFFSFSAILGLLFLAALLFLAWKLLPPYINNYQLQSEIENLSRTATYNRTSESDIRNAILDRASELGIELDQRQVIVQKSVGAVNIAVHYEIPVNLLVREYVLTFDPAAGNRNITAR
ncbi:MAG: DUF4845 domain-containing protein [Acidobacteria bacterium]|nr:DUF4845 domain-containing protein [Acidobacteriota bacterium]